MPALFGYLVALTLLLGGGYAGLQWLAAPDGAGTHQRIGEKPTARNMAKKSEQSEKSELSAAKASAVPGEADGESQTGTSASAAAATEAPQKSGPEASETETISAPGDPALGASSDHAAAGGCLPFGVTARGADVFPIQCQASIERQRGSVTSAAPPPTAPAPAKVQAVELAKPADSRAAITRPARPDPASSDGAHTGPKDDVAAASGTRNLNSEPDPRPAKSADASREGGGRDAAHRDDAQAKDIAGTPKPDPAIKPGKPDKRQVKRHPRSSRSRLVMMYMRTIEYPDGHREQQLLPLRPSRRMAVETEDEW